MNWAQLIKIRRWTPLRKLGVGPRLLKGFLYKIDENCYFIGVPRDEGPDDERFITGLLWAESEGAALRADLKEIEGDRTVVNNEPPQEMLLSQGATTYGTIIDILKSSKSKDFTEVAGYRMRDGAFVHREIITPQLNFYFRSLKEIKDENPYAIRRRLDE